jgi:hypothetical protein
MRRLMTIAAIVASVTGALIPVSGAQDTASKPFKLAQLPACFLTREQILGSLKLCIYNCGGATYTMTVGMTDTCPFSPR